MSYPIQITFRHVPDSASLKRRLSEEAESLGHYFERIVACRVLLESPHQHHRKGQLYRTRVILKVPGKELVVGRNPTQHRSHEDAYVSIGEAFEEARRQLRDYVMVLHGRVKAHETRRAMPAPELPSAAALP